VKPIRDILEMSVQVSKDPKWRKKESNNLYYIPFFIYVIWNTILIGFISTGIKKINQTLSPIANLTIFLAVGIMSFILLIGVASHAHQLKNFHYPQVTKNVILSKKLARKGDIFYESFDSR
jgi:hypothetical protein